MKTFDFRSTIIEENEDYIIINKPPYISSLQDRHEGVSLLEQAKAYSADAQLCHRLDKETSGIMIIAKHPEAYRHMSMQFEHRKIEKTYHALVEGVQDVDGIKIEMPLLPISRGKVRVDFNEGKPSETLVKTHTAYKQHTLLECRPVTGRMHQIRVHLASVGMPLVGDDVYGGKPIFLSSLKRKFNLKKETEELPLIKRFALHAYSIKYTDIKGNQILSIAPYPKDFDVLIKQLNKFAL